MMKKMKKIFALMTGAAISLGMMSGVRAEAATTGIFTDFMEMTSLNDIPEGCEELRNTEIYNNHQAYFAELGPYAYRSKEFPTIFYYFNNLYFNKILLNVDNEDGQWREIYDKYKDKLNFGEPLIMYKYIEPGNKVITGARLVDTIYTGRDVCSNWNGVGLNDERLDFSADVDFSNIETKVQDLYDTIFEKYSVIMEMIAEMKEANCINGATYTPFDANANSIWTRSISIDGYKGTDEDLEELIRSKVSGNPNIECGTNDSGLSYASVYFANIELADIDLEQTFKTGGTAEDFFALYEMFKGMEKEMGLSVTMYHSLRDLTDVVKTPELEDISISSKSIDCFAVLDSAGDVNIDGRLGIQDIIAVNKNISEIITFNYEQSMAADMNYDGIIDIDDLGLLMHRIID